MLTLSCQPIIVTHARFLLLLLFYLMQLSNEGDYGHNRLKCIRLRKDNIV